MTEDPSSIRPSVVPQAGPFAAPDRRVPTFCPTAADRALAAALGAALDPDRPLDDAGLDAAFAASSLPQRWERLVLVLYAPGQRRRCLVSRLWGGRYQRLAPLVARLRGHERFGDLVASARAAGWGPHLQLDFVPDPPQACDLARVGMTVAGADHFEIGLDGLDLTDPDGKRHFFLPGDAYVRSIMAMSQLRAHLARQVGGPETLAACRVLRFTSRSYLLCDGVWHGLYRGRPPVGPLTRATLETAVDLAIDHIKRTQTAQGRYLYYYDAATDSTRDHEHPTRDPRRNPYYNILRHAGGALTCLFHEKLRRRGDTLDGVRRAIAFLIRACVERDIDGAPAAYVYYNRKAKLGGSGLFLYLLAEYELHTGDGQYRPWAERLARHVMSQITESGEFIYYHIYLGKPVTPADNDRYFSFYYPGEAVVGLALFLALPGVAEPWREEIRAGLRRALRFLLEVRPHTRADHYTAVPSDSWLMMGIKELWRFPEMRDPAYAAFVFGDADAMVDKMYTGETAPYPDYVGAFYYTFGDYPYADGARCEGLLGAYQLAVMMGERERAGRYWSALTAAAWATAHLVNTREAVYAAPNPAIALGGIRFKYTRQWFRIDTIQHVASFYAKLLPHWDHAEERAG